MGRKTELVMVTTPSGGAQGDRQHGKGELGGAETVASRTRPEGGRVAVSPGKQRGRTAPRKCHGAWLGAACGAQGPLVAVGFTHFPTKALSTGQAHAQAVPAQRLRLAQTRPEPPSGVAGARPGSSEADVHQATGS